jgi:hypothetical protein
LYDRHRRKINQPETVEIRTAKNVVGKGRRETNGRIREQKIN